MSWSSKSLQNWNLPIWTIFRRFFFPKLLLIRLLCFQCFLFDDGVSALKVLHSVAQMHEIVVAVVVYWQAYLSNLGPRWSLNRTDSSCDSCEIADTSQTWHQCLFIRWRAPPCRVKGRLKTDCLPSVWLFVKNSTLAPVIGPSRRRPRSSCRRKSDYLDKMTSVKIRNLKKNRDPIAFCVVIGATWWRQSAALMSVCHAKFASLLGDANGQLTKAPSCACVTLKYFRVQTGPTWKVAKKWALWPAFYLGRPPVAGCGIRSKVITLWGPVKKFHHLQMLQV